MVRIYQQKASLLTGISLEHRSEWQGKDQSIDALHQHALLIINQYLTVGIPQLKRLQS